MGKIIQIAITGHNNTINTQCDWTLIALCDDGRLWCLSNTGRWTEIPLPTDSAACSAAIPEGVYYSVVHANFYRVGDCCRMGTAFYEQWRSRCDEFPSPWGIQDHLGTYRGDEVAHTAEEAIAKYAVKQGISSKDISHWRAVRR